ncbi:Pre-mRNA splicing Prp18-interacting factor-domain-containing protein [Paraphysoderma sedebokerense]|nr:Pre-mRNA splicing Prp18-interacting factor-domain-containing protein [Paraphysoderma sedebokerense]
MSTTQKLTKEEYRKQKDLEAARKAGTAPPELDEEGNMINPHIPQYISQAPWYIDDGKPSLKHQRVESSSLLQSESGWYARGARVGPAATKFRKGACENCGAMTHKTKECMERPRAKGAKWTGKDIQADEVVQDVELGFDAKRDRWNGYNAEEHKNIMQEWELIEEERKRQKAKEVDEKLLKGGNDELEEIEGSSDEDIADEDKYAEQLDMPGQKVDTKTRVTVRNLRIREDIPKYLRNLDPNSAYYDPKTRSMRDAPVKDKAPNELDYAGDNFVRHTGDTIEMAKLQLFAWDAAERGHEVHLQTNPSQAELLYREYLKKKSELKDTVKDSILEKYGGAEHLQAPPKELLLAQTEEYVEYSRTGKVIKGVEKAKVRSRYEEDVYHNNHTSVWGSYFAKDTREWGYKCCHSVIRNSYCTGQAGIEASKSSVIIDSVPNNGSSSSTTNTQNESNGTESNKESSKSLMEQHLQNWESQLKSSKKSKKKSKSTNSTQPSSHKLPSLDPSLHDSVDLDSKKLSKALEKEKLSKAKSLQEDGDDKKNKKRKYNSEAGYEDANGVSDEQLEAYRLLKRRMDDPMANYVDEDD